MQNGDSHRDGGQERPFWKRSPGREVRCSVLGYELVWFTRHALDRMKQRGVTQAEVLAVLQEPDKKGLKTQPDRERWRKNRSRKVAIDVVFERWPDKICIVTVIVIGP